MTGRAFLYCGICGRPEHDEYDVGGGMKIRPCPEVPEGWIVTDAPPVSRPADAWSCQGKWPPHPEPS